jgi:uncharacterized protein (TIGR00255 family)
MANAKPIRSMTGFAQVRRDTAAGELTVSLRGVNHRGLDLHFHQSHEFSPFENGMRALLKQNIGRGHIEIRAGIARNNGQRGGLNIDTLKQHADVFQKAAESLGLDSKPDLNVLLTLPGVFSQNAEAQELGPEFEAVLLDALTACAAEFNDCRQREGAKLAEDMLVELREAEKAAAGIKALRATVLPAFQQRLVDKLRELLNGSGIADSRIMEECALLADRSDIQEELTRLSVHALELRRILDGGGAIGKQIDFLLQEMNRETNTILSKSASAGDAGLKITGHGLSIKANIERVREQALNLE